MNHPLARLALVTASLLAVACTDNEIAGDANDALLARAAAIHRAVMTIDSHDDISFDFATAAVDPLDAARQVTLEKMREGEMNVAFFIVYVG